MIGGCQHSFCLGCLILRFEGKHDLYCPTCDLAFIPTEVAACNVRNRLIEELKIKCTCGENFKSHTKFEMHKSRCKQEGSMMTVTDSLNLDVTSPIPPPVERATLRILQHKVNTSDNGTAEFASGGPRVSVHLS